MASASTSSGILGDIVEKGPTTESQFAYKTYKMVYKKLIAYCTPLPAGVVTIYDEQPVINDGESILLPPGQKHDASVLNLWVPLQSLHQRNVHADKSQTDKAIGAHAKLVPLAKKVRIIFQCHRQQCRLDLHMMEVQEAFSKVVSLESFTRTDVTTWALLQIQEIAEHHQVATAEASALVEASSRNAVLLIPSTGGWEGAMKEAKESGFLKQDFPDLSVHPLNNVAAIEIKQVAVQRRQGIRRVTVLEGKLRLIDSSTHRLIIEKGHAGEVTEIGPGKLQVLPIQASEDDVIPASWIEFPSPLDATSSLLRAELLDVDTSKLLRSLEDFANRWRWFAISLVDFLKRREKYSRRPLNRYWNFRDLMAFPKEFINCLSENLMDQVPDEGSMAMTVKGFLETFVKVVHQDEAEFFRTVPDVPDDDDEDDDHEKYEYLELQPDVLRPPPLNPDYVESRSRDAVGIAEVGEPSKLRKPPNIPQSSTKADIHQSNLQSREQDVTKEFRKPRSRSSSYDSQVTEGNRREGGESPITGFQLPVTEGERDGGGGRFSPSATTASQLRGEDRSHSIALQLQRSRQLLINMIADPDSTKYKIQREKVGKMLFLAEKHLREDTVSVSYGDFLIEEMSRAENDCALKDDELDLAEKKKKKVEGDKRDLLATLPRGLGQKFSGSAADYPAFRHYFVEINESFPPPLAVAHMTALIECPKLKKRMKIYRSGEEVLKDFDKDFGQSFLNCQTIINSINKLEKATNKGQEMDLILKYRHAKRSLDMNADHEKLLNVPQMIQWADLLLPTTCDELMMIIQDAEYGEVGSAVEKYFLHLEKVYERNSVLIRNRDARQLPAKGGGRQDQARHGKKVGFETDMRSYGNEEREGSGCGYFCSSGRQHPTYFCPLLKDGKISLKKVRQAKLCSCCLTSPGSCNKGKIQRKDGSVASLICEQCKHHKRISCHQNCKKKGGSHGPVTSGPVGGPPVEMPNSGPVAASLTELRTEMAVSYLANPNPLGSASEMVDYVVLVAPDGSRRMIRCIYDGGGTDTVLDFKLSRYFHHHVPAVIGVNGANTSRNFASHVGELQVQKADGSCFTLKAIKGDLSAKAFTLKEKFVDVPPPFHPHFDGTHQTYNDAGDLRVKNVVEDFQVQLLIGLDACAMAPMELARYHDECGQLVLWRSLISNQVIVTGSRRTGASTTVRTSSNQRSYVITEEGNYPVSLMRTAVETQDSRELFTRRSNLTKIEKKLYAHIEDNDQIVPPQPELCESCKGCHVCSDPFRARREQTVLNLLDQLVKFKEGPRDKGGGFHVRLLYDPDLLERVPVGREAALRRLLATERQLMKPEMGEARKYFNAKVEKCRERGYLLTPDQFTDLSHLQKAYQPFSFALKDEENLGGMTRGIPLHKTKARPVVDCSAVAVPGMISLNASQFKIPDIHTWKISQILLKLRSAKRFCIADVTEFYFRLFCDNLTTSMTRVLFRDGGLGEGGVIVELVSPVTSMGIKQIPTFAAHVRYRVSLTIVAADPEAAAQLRRAYFDDVLLFERFDECKKGEGHHGECDDGEILVNRAGLVEEALKRAHLYFGDKWLTDVEQGKCSESMSGIMTAGEEVALTLGNSLQTSALGYRVHLGPKQPSGGSLLWRVHRPQTLNLEPKLRGARPDWAQLADGVEIRQYLRERGVTKASLLSLCSSLYCPLLLTGVFISSARQLFRQVLREVKLDSWKALVPEKFHERIACLAEDLLTVSKTLKIPRLAVVPNPIQAEAHRYPIGYATLLVISDGSCEAGAASCYVHQMFPFDAGKRGPEDDFTDVKVTCNLLCSTVKLTDCHGNNSQVCGELLGKFIGVQLKEFVKENILIDFHEVRVCSDSLTVERAIRKTDACYSTWAGRRIASIQRGLDLDESYHVPHTITDSTIDPCTKFQKFPSKFLTEKWFHAQGVLDKPLQLLPFTDRSTYMFPRIEDLPSQWLSSAARTFLGLKLPAVIIMKMEVNVEEVPMLSVLENLANKYTNLEKAITVLQHLLRMKPAFRGLPVTEQREACLQKFVSQDYEKISQQLGQRSTRLTQQLVLEDDKEKRTFTMKGRFGYKARLLANPKSSSLSRLVLRSAHSSHHLASSARIMAKVERNHIFTGGALRYLDKLRASCAMCKLLKPEAVKTLLGDPPAFMRGPLSEAITTWTAQSMDIFGPMSAAAFLRAKGTRAAPKKLKIWGLLVFDYASRAIDAELCGSYSTDSVILAMKAVWSRVGRPKFLNFDAAANLASAGDIIGGEEGLEQPSLAEGERLQRELRQQLGNQIEMRPRVPFAPHRQVVERSVQFCKRQIRQMLHHTAGGLLTPLEASSILSCAIAHINERPLIVHGAPDEQGVITPWFLTPRSISAFHSQRVEEGDNLEHPLSRRAFQAQQRLELFKGQFNVFYHKQMVRFGHWNTQNKQPGVGDTCLILDKIKGKAHFLQKFQLGRIREIVTPHVCEIDYVKQNPEVTAALIRDLRNQSDDWRKRYQVKVSTCTRDGRNLAILCSKAQGGRLREGFEVDLFMEQPDPRDLAPDADGGDKEVPNVGVQQQGGDQQEVHAQDLVPDERGEQHKVLPSGDAVPQILPKGDISENIEGDGALGLQDGPHALKKPTSKKKNKEKWVFHR